MDLIVMLLWLICAQFPIPKVTEMHMIGSPVSAYHAIEDFVDVSL